MGLNKQSKSSTAELVLITSRVNNYEKFSVNDSLGVDKSALWWNTRALQLTDVAIWKKTDSLQSCFICYHVFIMLYCVLLLLVRCVITMCYLLYYGM